MIQDASYSEEAWEMPKIQKPPAETVIQKPPIAVSDDIGTTGFVDLDDLPDVVDKPVAKGVISVTQPEPVASVQQPSKAAKVETQSQKPKETERIQPQSITPTPTRKLEDVLNGAESAKKDQNFLVKIKSKLPLIGAVAIFIVIVVIVFKNLPDWKSSKKNNKSEKEAAEQTITEAPPAQVVQSKSITYYTPDEVEALRENGYTGDEIEEYDELEMPAENLIEAAIAVRTALYEEEAKPYQDSKSEEYKKLEADTWVGQPKLKIDSDITGYTYYSDITNVDYKKLPARGMQLFVKLVFPEGEVAFMTVTPERYLTLRNEGNIVVEYNYILTSEDKKIIISIQERDIAR